MPELRRRYGVEELALLGSTVRGEAGPESDIDVLVGFTTPPTLFRLVELEDELTAILGRRVDLVLKSALKPRIAQRSLQEAVEV